MLLRAYLVVVDDLVEGDYLVVEVFFAGEVGPVQNSPQQFRKNLVSHRRPLPDHLTHKYSTLLYTLYSSHSQTAPLYKPKNGAVLGDGAVWQWTGAV